jgi:hypothetical protein
VITLAPDWVLLFPKERAPFPADLPLGLNEVLVKWVRSQQSIRIRTTLPIVKDGNLVAIHVWFDKIVPD